MKQYFTRHKSKLPEYVQMKRIAIKRMRNDNATYKEIAEVIGISQQAVSKLHKKWDGIDKEIQDKFCLRVAMGHYPMFKNKRIIWEKL
jgi:DNA-directed RNA polymerase specialized sigma subunit